MRKRVYLRGSVKWREQRAGIMVPCCSGNSCRGTAPALMTDKGMLCLGSNGDCTFHHRRAAHFLNISSLLLTESLRQMSQRVGRDSGRRLRSGTPKSVRLEGRVESRRDVSCFGTRTGSGRLRTMSAELSRKSPLLAESKDKWVVLICHNLPVTLLNLSGSVMTGTAVSVLLPLHPRHPGGGCDIVPSDWKADYI